MNRHPSYKQGRRGGLASLRRFALLFVLIGALALPARPAHAIAGIDDAIIGFIEGMHLNASWARSLANQVGMAISGYIKVLMEAVRARGEYDRSKAVEDFRNEITRRSIESEFLLENMSSPNQSACRATTAFRRSLEGEAQANADMQDTARRETERRLGMVSTLGSGSPGGDTPDGGDPSGVPTGDRNRINGRPGGNSTASAVDLARASCVYSRPTPASRRSCEQLGVDPAMVGRYESQDVNAGVLLDAVSFDNGAHAQAALDYCRNINVNRQMEISSQASAVRSGDSLAKNRDMYAEAAVASLVDMICFRIVAERVPEEGDYLAFETPVADVNQENNAYNKLYTRYLNPLGWRPLDASVEPATAENWPPRYADGENEGEIEHTSYSASFRYIPGRSPSAQQRQLFALSKINDATAWTGASTSPHEAMQHTIIAKAANISQNFQRLRYMEQQLLLASIELGREVRSGNR